MSFEQIQPEAASLDEEPDDPTIDPTVELNISTLNQYSARQRSVANVDYEALLREALTDEEHDKWLSMRAKIEEEGKQAALDGEIAYDRARKLDDMYGVEVAADDYRRAADLLISASATDGALSTHYDVRRTNPTTYFKIADAFTKQAEAAGIDTYEDVVGDSGEIVYDHSRNRLGGLALMYFDRGIDTLLAGDGVGRQKSTDRAELVAAAIAEAAIDIDKTQEHPILRKVTEEELASQLEAGGPKHIKRFVRNQGDTLEMISASSEILNQELSDSHEFSLSG